MAYLVGTASNHLDLMNTLVRFLAGQATFTAPIFTGAGTGLLLNQATYPDTLTETWTVTCTSAAPGGGMFSVTGSVSGSQATAAVGVNYDNGSVKFNLVAGAVDFQVGDQFTFQTTAGAMGAGERWQTLRYTGVDAITASSFVVDWEPWRAFKNVYGQHTNGWSTAIGQTDSSWLSWKFVEPLDLARFQITGSSTLAQSPRDFSLQWSDDGINWVTRQTWTGITWTASQVRSFTVDGASPGAKYHWRLLIATNNGDASYTRLQGVYFPEFQFTAEFYHSRRPAAWFKAPGMTGLDPVYVNFHIYDRPTNDIFNLAVTAATGFVGASNFDDQPGALTAMAVPLWDKPMAFWISANGQRVIVSVKVDTSYMTMYVGKMLPFGTPGQFPYPVIVAAPLSTATETRYSSTANTLPFKGNRANMKLRSANGTWVQPYAWPWTFTTGEAKTFRDTNGAYPLMPITLYDTSNTYGVLDGVKYITGFSNAAENLVTAGAETHVVLQDVTRNGLSDFFAMRIA